MISQEMKIACLALWVASSEALLISGRGIPAASRGCRATYPLLLADGTAGKGFGASPPSAAGGGGTKQPAAAPASVPIAPDSPAVSEAEMKASAEARGRAALEAMRQESKSEALKPNRGGMELTPEELEPMDPSEGVMPEVVSQRMAKRVVPFAGVPIVLGGLAFVGFWFANTQLDMDLPPSIVGSVTFGLLLLSFGGISYGIMSTSWDEEKEGSVLGTEEIGKNIALMRADLESSRLEAEAEQQLDEANDAGIIMSPAQLRKREKKRSKKKGRK